MTSYYIQVFFIISWLFNCFAFGLVLRQRLYCKELEGKIVIFYNIHAECCRERFKKIGLENDKMRTPHYYTRK